LPCPLQAGASMYKQIFSECFDARDAKNTEGASRKSAAVKAYQRLGRSSVALAVSIVLALAARPAMAANPPPMSVPGHLSVGQDGSAGYSIPIVVPQGTAGMAPSLSLSYSSRFGDGIVGYGWSLSGLPAITRCPRTMAEDGVHGGVEYNSNDRLCLNGQRLVAVSGTYGANGTQYSTEIESFEKVVSYGTAGNGPSYFEVWTKSGQIMEFGNTTDSKILAVGSSTARSWALDKVTDVKGNYYTVTYSNDTTNGQYYPTRIDYTGNSSAGLSTYNSVQFIYTASRADVTPTYQAGSLRQTTILLTDVKTYQGSNLVYDYQLRYRPGTSTTHSRLNSVTLCGGSGNCLAPTSFGWQGGTGTLSVTSASTPTLKGALFRDFNGDGIIDALQPKPTSFNCSSGLQASFTLMLGSSSGSFTQSQLAATSTNGFFSSNCSAITASLATATLDFNGDGLADIVLTLKLSNCATGDYYAELSFANTGQGALTNTYTITGWGGPPCATPYPLSTSEDVNGDGLDEWVEGIPGYTFQGGQYQWYYTSFAAYVLSAAGQVKTTLGFGINSATSAYLGDYDGHGCGGLLTQGTNNMVVYPCNTSLSSITIPSMSGQIIVGDFNGDGTTDVLNVPTSGNGTLYLSTGTGLVATSYTVPSSWDSCAVVVGDFNGDGKSDIAVDCGSTISIYLSTGSGFVLATTIANNDSGTMTAQDLNSDGANDLLVGSTSYTFSYTPELMTSVSNGIGATTAIAYDRLNKNGSFYTKCPNNPSSYVCGDSYPTQDVDNAQYVVSSITSSNGIGGTDMQSYAYAGAKKDLKGRGFLGFSSITITDVLTGIVKTTNYHTDFPFIGLVSSQTTATSGGVTLNSVTNTYADTDLGAGTDGVEHYFVYLLQSVVSGSDENFTTGNIYALPTTTNSYTYDSYGNATQIVTAVSDGSSRTTTNTYNNDATNWILGKLTSTVAQSIVGSSNITRISCFQYDNTMSQPYTYGLLTREVVQPVSTTNCTPSSIGVETDYTYDSTHGGQFGYRTTATVSGPGITTRTTTATYDSYGQFMTQSCDAANECHTYTYDARFGTVTSDTDPNGLVNSASYDTFGRLVTAVKSDGNKAVTSYAYCSGVNGGSASCPTYGAVVATAVPENSSGTTNGASMIAYYDSLGRPIATDAQGFGGSWIRQSQSYDAYGVVVQASRPYLISGGTVKWTTFSHDVLGRVVQTVTPNGATTTYAYEGLTTSMTNADSQTTTTVGNAQGRVASVTDALGHVTSYVYDAFGGLTRVTDPAGNTITNTFDVLGNKTASSDPDMGRWSYAYDVLGELTSQTDANGRTVTLSYDLVGRPTVRSENSLYSTWTYGSSSANHNVGALVEAKACSASGCSSVVSDRTFSYDGLSRPSSSTLTVDGNAYTYTSSYNSDGRLSAVAYPSGLSLAYVYDGYGYPAQIKNSSSGTTYWTANSRDAELHLLSQTFGNGVTQSDTFDANTGLLTNIRAGSNNGVAQFDYAYDPLGNLTYRADDYEGTFEYACYDNLNRLTQYAVGNAVTACSSSQNHKTVTYDALGDITAKSDVGTYSYPTAGNTHPHAVSSITGTVNGVVNPTYSYDANGNMTSGAGRTVSYTSFNMAASIVAGSTTVSLTYDSEHERVKMVSPSGTTYYLNDPISGLMEEKLISGSTTTWHDYLIADGRIVAEKFSGGTAAVRYFVTDHLDSIAVVTDENGNVVERDAYDAWGKRRNLDGSDNTACSLTSLTTRGFTGQEEIDAECLINANARIYDPSLGRFMTADSTVPDPFDAQSFNRYSYVRNNPLLATDPTGYDDDGPDRAPGEGEDTGPKPAIAVGSDVVITALNAAMQSCTSSCGAIIQALAEANQTGLIAVSTLQALQTIGITGTYQFDNGDSTSGALALPTITDAIANGTFASLTGAPISGAGIGGGLNGGSYAVAYVPWNYDSLGSGDSGIETVTVSADRPRMVASLYSEYDTNGAGGLQYASYWDTLQPFKAAFFNNYAAPIHALEKRLGVCHDCILGVAAEESQWGRSRGATQLNNLFGMDNSSGTKILDFSSIQAGIDHWAATYGPSVQGDMNMSDFVTDLASAYNSRDPRWSTNITQTIESVQHAETLWTPPGRPPI